MSAHVADPTVSFAHVPEGHASSSPQDVEPRAATRSASAPSSCEASKDGSPDTVPYSPDSTAATIEAALQRGLDACKNNPTVAILGAASVAALIVLSVKASRPKGAPFSLIDMENRVATALANQSTAGRRVGNELIESLSAGITRAIAASPAELTELGKAAEQWIARARGQISKAASSANGK